MIGSRSSNSAGLAGLSDFTYLSWFVHLTGMSPLRKAQIQSQALTREWKPFGLGTKLPVRRTWLQYSSLPQAALDILQFASITRGLFTPAWEQKSGLHHSRSNLMPSVTMTFRAKVSCLWLALLYKINASPTAYSTNQEKSGQYLMLF